MPNLTMTGVPAAAMQVGFAIIGTLPVWCAGKLVGAENGTMLRCGVSIVMGVIGSAIVGAIFGGYAVLMIPILFLSLFKYILGTSYFGAFIMCLIITVGYISLFSNIGSGFNFSP